MGELTDLEERKRELDAKLKENKDQLRGLLVNEPMITVSQSDNKLYHTDRAKGNE